MFDYKEWLDEIREVTDIEEGTDDIIYGNYVDWDRFRIQFENELLINAGFELPWGKTLTFNEYIQLIFNFIAEYKLHLDDFLINEIIFNSETEYLYDIIVNFIERDTKAGDLIVSKLLDLYGVPSGTAYEKCDALPNELTYWDRMIFNDDELISYYRYPVNFIDYEDKINAIFQKIKDTSDNLIKKSLLLSSFSITESMFKSSIVEKITRELYGPEYVQKITRQAISKKLRGSVEERRDLFKEVYKIQAPSLIWNDLRNSLAHDIEESQIKNNIITYTNLKNNKLVEMNIDELKRKQIEFFYEIKRIIQ